MKDISKQQDARDLADLVDAYLPHERCIGGRRVMPGYSCLHCGSSDPGEVCHGQKVRHPKHRIDDYIKEEDRKAVRAYEAYPALKLTLTGWHSADNPYRAGV